MANAATSVANKPIWIDLGTTDPDASRAFYSKLFGWQIEVNPDPQYGGYALAKSGGHDVAGIGPQMSPDAPSAWSIYIATDDADALAAKVEAAGGKIVAPPMQIGDQGKMVVFQDPSGAFLGAWQAQAMNGFHVGATNGFGWAELNARGLDKDVPFYRSVFGWTARTAPMGEGMPDYTEWQVNGESIGGGMEMTADFPAGMPSYWLVYFGVADVDAAFAKGVEAGGKAMVPPTDFPGGRFGILADPQGAAFGLLKMAPR
jgi:uncharacterized protein